jgi:hypothetical protein
MQQGRAASAEDCAAMEDTGGAAPTHPDGAVARERDGAAQKTHLKACLRGVPPHCSLQPEGHRTSGCFATKVPCRLEQGSRRGRLDDLNPRAGQLREELHEVG